MPRRTRRPQTAAPVADPAHPHAVQYQLAVQLLALANDGHSSYYLFWEILDDTPMMHQVYRWLLTWRWENRSHQYCANWCKAGYLGLIAIYLECHPNSKPIVCQGCFDQIEILRICLAQVGERWRLGKHFVLFALQHEVSAQAAILTVESFAGHPELRPLLQKYLPKQRNLKTWRILSDRFSITITREILGKMHPILLADCYQNGSVTSYDLIKMMRHRAYHQTWSKSFLLQHPDAIATIAPMVADYGLDLLEMIKVALTYESSSIIRTIIQLLPDLHASHDHLFWELVKTLCQNIACEEGFPDSVKKILRWMVRTYQIDPLERGSYLLTIDYNSISHLFYLLTENRSARYCYGEGMRCVISSYPLTMNRCRRYLLDGTIYLYTRNMRWDGPSAAFVLDRWTANENVRSAMTSARDRSVPLAPDLVSVIDLSEPDLEQYASKDQIPGFLAQTIASMASRAKSPYL